MVSSRAKRIDRLKDKLDKRNKTRNYKNKVAIEKDIPDLAGVRVALYFPSEREIVGEVIEELFEVIETKIFPENPHKPKFGKRFSGYWATHYRLKLKRGDDVDSRFTNTVFEIQVASVLMHAWSEVEHDLVYKPLSGDLSDEELAILDEINGLVLSGEIALERLQKAITERTTKQKEVSDKYELTNLIHYNYNNNVNKILNFGNTEYINNYLKAVQTLQTSDILNSLQKINFNINESFSDQFLQNIIKINQSTDNLKKYFGQYTNDKKKISGFESFMKTWIVFEKIITQLNVQFGNDNRKNFIPSLDILGKLTDFNQEELEQIKESRKIRSQLLHGYQSYSNEELEFAYEKLKTIVNKCLNTVNDIDKKEELIKELK